MLDCLALLKIEDFYSPAKKMNQEFELHMPGHRSKLYNGISRLTGITK